MKERVVFGVCTTMALFSVGIPSAEVYSVELDLDGQLGNGPDVIASAVSDQIDVDAWIHGPVGLIGFGITTCNWDGSLELQGVNYSLPDTWDILPPGMPPPACVMLGAYDFAGTNPITLPWMVATLTYHAAIDHSFGEITVYLPVSGWVVSQSDDGLFDSYVGVGVQIGTTGIEESSWGSIKSLFR